MESVKRISSKELDLVIPFAKSKWKTLGLPMNSTNKLNEKDYCSICGLYDTSEIIKCNGICNGFFHAKCTGFRVKLEETDLNAHTSSSTDFTCSSCLSGTHSCFMCNSSEGNVTKCSVSTCEKFYHYSCIQSRPLSKIPKQSDEQEMVCPRHYCHMCATNHNDLHDLSSKIPPFTRCLLCPTAYHTVDTCIPAGIDELNEHYHICAKHFHLQQSAPVNVKKCFSCSESGVDLYCKLCPSSFHRKCLDSNHPKSDFICSSCQNGKYPVYGDIIWAKLGTYRWWPGEVLHPDSIPENVLKLTHQKGMLCVYFYGSRNYSWMPRGRTFLFHPERVWSKQLKRKALGQQFNEAIKEAIIAYRRLERIKEKALDSRLFMKLQPYVRLTQFQIDVPSENQTQDQPPPLHSKASRSVSKHSHRCLD